MQVIICKIKAMMPTTLKLWLWNLLYLVYGVLESWWVWWLYFLLWLLWKLLWWLIDSSTRLTERWSLMGNVDLWKDWFVFLCFLLLPAGSVVGFIISTDVDGEKLRAVLLINPTKSTLLLILNRGEVGQKPKADLLYLVQQATDTSSIFSNQTSSKTLSPKLSEPNSIITLILYS